ncbi:MAG: AzlD domain-containing protein [Magnetospirillum sp.]|nr:AzlD domain-containing protein [Magnetospirillum sp.]
MSAELLLAAVLGGGATYLIRLLPILAGDRLKGRAAPARAQRFLRALGPAAIAALLVLSLKDLLPAGAGQGRALLVLAAGSAAVLLTQRLTRNPALATLAGAAAVGLLHAITGA